MTLRLDIALWQRAAPWNDRKGAFSPLKAATLLVVILPGLWIALRLGLDQLGAKPITAALHETGTWSIRLLLLTLAISPLRLITGFNRLILIRRMLGVSALVYALIHVGLYVFEQKFAFWRIASEIVLRFYLTIGFVAFLALIALGLTSTDGAIRRLGAPAWNRLHRLVYPLSVLALWHGFLQAKIDVSEDVVMAGVFLALMGVRVARGRLPLGPLTLSGLTLAAMLAAAGIEYAWYALATGVPAGRVFSANFVWALQPRPAIGVGMIALILPLAAIAMRARSRRQPASVRQAPLPGTVRASASRST
jgi:methionine sulfoxide reductase heme-binding subunit